MLPLPPGYLERSLREQLALLSAAGLSALEARLALAGRLWARSRQELEHIERQAWPADWRRVKTAASCHFWAQWWSTLRYHLEHGEHAEAEALVDRALDRVSPRSGPAPAPHRSDRS